MRGKYDRELEELGQNVMDSLQMIAYTNNALSAKRRELIKPYLSVIYAKMRTRAHDESPDWLYGGNLAESTKQCEVAKRIGDKMLKRKPLINRHPTGNKRFRQPFQPPGFQNGMQMQMLRAFNPLQMQQVRFAPPNVFQQGGYSQVVPGSMPMNMGFPRRFRYPRYQQQQQQRQTFQNKGNFQK